MRWLLFYDDDCGMCSMVASQVRRHDHAARIQLEPLSGEVAVRYGVSFCGRPDTVVLLESESGEQFTHSDAVIQMAALLGGRWKWLSYSRMLPRAFRDGVYRWVARHRHRLSGGSRQCRVPQAHHRD